MTAKLPVRRYRLATMLTIGILVGGLAGQSLSAPAPAPQQPAASPFGRLVPMAPTGQTRSGRRRGYSCTAASPFGSASTSTCRSRRSCPRGWNRCVFGGANTAHYRYRPPTTSPAVRCGKRHLHPDADSVQTVGNPIEDRGDRASRRGRSASAAAGDPCRGCSCSKGEGFHREATGIPGTRPAAPSPDPSELQRGSASGGSRPRSDSSSHYARARGQHGSGPERSHRRDLRCRCDPARPSAP